MEKKMENEMEARIIQGFIRFLAVSQIKGTQHRPQNIILLIMETPKKAPLIVENLHMGVT